MASSFSAAPVRITVAAGDWFVGDDGGGAALPSRKTARPEASVPTALIIPHLRPYSYSDRTRVHRFRSVETPLLRNWAMSLKVTFPPVVDIKGQCEADTEGGLRPGPG